MFVSFMERMRVNVCPHFVHLPFQIPFPLPFVYKNLKFAMNSKMSEFPFSGFVRRSVGLSVRGSVARKSVAHKLRTS